MITRLGEKKLIDHFGVVWLTHFPRLIAPFYQAKSIDGLTVECADLLIGIGETVGCGERHATGEDVRLGLEEHQVPVADYEWYVQMKNKYPLRTAGFGLGLERFLLWVLQHNDYSRSPSHAKIKENGNLVVIEVKSRLLRYNYIRSK